MSRPRTRTESIDNTCPVCHEDMVIFAIGPCDHPVCYRCSTRMRVLCETADCPICRSLMPQVAFVSERKSFRDINLRECIPNRKNKIFYQDESMEESYLNLLEFRCRICINRKPDRTFVLLQTHMRREHQLFACDLCLANLKIFPYEKKFYDRKSLAIHRRLGDSDDKSYKGHPLCEFCDQRYNDKDDLMKHLRKDHYYCHFCDQQGSNAYYNEYPDLKAHFGESHYLCTEDICDDPNTQFTHAFSSEIDLKAHKAKMHTKNMSKLQSREARSIDVNFQFQPRRQGYGGRGHSASSNGDESYNRGNRGGDRQNRRPEREDAQLLKALAESMEMSRSTKTPPPVQEAVPDPLRDFPTLGGAPAAVPVKAPSNAQTAQPVEDFPSLSSANHVASSGQLSVSTSSRGYAAAMHFQSHQPAKTSPKEKKSESKPVSLGTVAQKSGDRWARPAPKVTEEDFPSLGGRTSKSGNFSLTSDLGPSDWSKVPASTSEFSSNVSVITNKNDSDQNSKKVKLKTSNQLNKNLKDDGEFPSLGGNNISKEDILINNPLWQKTKSFTKTNSQQPRSQRYDDNSFVLPESYNKSHEYNSSEVDLRTEKTYSVEVKKDTAPPPLNQKKEFPGLPTREPKSKVILHAENKKDKVKSKEKKPEPKIEKQSKSKSKKTAGLSSLSDIADGLVVNGGAATAKLVTNSNNSFNRTSNTTSQQSKTKNKPDWFDNPGIYTSDELRKTTKSTGNVTKESDSDSASSKLAHVIDNSFPSLHSMSTPIQETRAPPPGFGASSSLRTIASSVSSVPPGFSKPSVAAPPPGFSAPKTPAVYIQPADFIFRNQKLIKEITQYLDTIENGFQNFKSLSGQYRQGMLDGSDYYLNCQKLMGEDDFCMVFPELIALLPDVAKQQELWAIHQTVASNRPDRSKGKSSSSSEAHALSPCLKCGQILLSKDKDHHNLQHGEDEGDFPALDGKVTKNGNSRQELRGDSSSGAWIKAK